MHLRHGTSLLSTPLPFWTCIITLGKEKWGRVSVASYYNLALTFAFWHGICRSLIVRKHRLNNLPRKPQPLKETFMLHFKASEAIFPLIWNTFGRILYNLTYFLFCVRFVYFHQIDFDMFAALYVWLSSKIAKIFIKKSKETIQPFVIYRQRLRD